MTAVEFIRQEFLEKLTNENYKKSFDEIFEQAKEMEKEQIEMAIRYFKNRPYLDITEQQYYEECTNIDIEDQNLKNLLTKNKENRIKTFKSE